MLKFNQIAERFGKSSRRHGTGRQRAGIGVRSAAVMRGTGESAESHARRNALRNLAVLSKTPSSSLLATIRSAFPDKQLIIVGVDGPTGAGRSHLCAEMQKRSEDVKVISASDFRRPIDQSALAELSSREVFEDCFDWERLRREVLEPLSKGQRAVYRKSGDAGSGEWVRIDPQGIVLFEGIYTLRPELYPLYDYTVFLKPDDRAPRTGDVIQAAEAWYQDAYHPAAMADTLLEGDWF